MGKLTSYLLGLTAALFLVYYVLYISYLPLINWLGPIVGSDIIFPFGFLFLLFGNPTSYPIILLSWVVISAFVAIGARKGTRAIGAAIAVYFSIWGFLVLAAVSILQTVTGGSLTSGIGNISSSAFSIPPLPAGASVSAILAEPIISTFSSIISNLPGISTLVSGTGGGSLSPTSTLGAFESAFVNEMLPYMIANLAVFIAVSGVFGTLIYRAIHRGDSPGKPGNGGKVKEPRQKKVKVKKTKVKRVVRKVSSVAGLLPAGLLAIFIAALMLLPPGGVLQSHSINTVQAGSSGTNSQALLNTSLETGNYIFSSAVKAASTNGTFTPTNLSLNYGGGFVGSYGNTYNIYAFLNESSKSAPAMFGSSSSSGQILSAVFVSYGLESIFNALKQDGFLNSSTVDSLQSNQLYNLIPQAAILEIYDGNVSVSSSSAMQAARALSSSIGGTGLSSFLSISLPVSNSTSQAISLFGYSLSVTNLGEEKTVSSALDPYFTTDGMLTVFQNGMNSGYLIPGNTPGSVEGSIFLAGHADLSQLPSSVSNLTNIFNSTGSSQITGNVYFMGGLFVKENVIHSSATTHNITGAQIFNYQGDVWFNSSQTLYALSILYPQYNYTPGSSVAGYRMYLYSNYQNFTPVGSAGNVTFILITQGMHISFGNVSLQTNVTFPAQLGITQTVTHVSGNTYRVSIQLRNNDSDQLSNVQVNAAPSLSAYGSSASVINGTTSSGTSSLQPGGTVSVSYDISLSGVGMYSVATPFYNYTINNSTFSVLGKTLTASAVNPSIFHAVNQVEYVSFSAVSNLIKFPYLVQQLTPGLYVFDLIVLLIVVLDVYVEYRAFRRWRSVRRDNREKPPEPPVEPDIPPDQGPE